MRSSSRRTSPSDTVTLPGSGSVSAPAVHATASIANRAVRIARSRMGALLSREQRLDLREHLPEGRTRDELHQNREAEQDLERVDEAGVVLEDDRRRGH